MQKAVNQHSVNGAESMPVLSSANAQTDREVNFFPTLTKVRNLPKKNIFAKDFSVAERLEIVLKAKGEYAVSEFFYTYQHHLDRLLCDRRFEADCVRNGLNPKIVAQHVVFAGKTKITRVWERGVEAVFGGLIFDMAKPIFDESRFLKASNEIKGLLPSAEESNITSLTEPKEKLVESTKN